MDIVSHILPGGKKLIHTIPYGGFGLGVVEFRRRGIEIFSLEQLDEAIADAAREETKTADETDQSALKTILENYFSSTWLAQNINYFPNGDMYFTLAENSPILQDPFLAMSAYCHEGDIYCYETDGYGHQIRKARSDAHIPPQQRVYYLDDVTAKELEERGRPDFEGAIETGVLFVPNTQVENIMEIRGTLPLSTNLLEFLHRGKAKKSLLQIYEINVFSKEFTQAHERPMGWRLYLNASHDDRLRHYITGIQELHWRDLPLMGFEHSSVGEVHRPYHN